MEEDNKVVTKNDLVTEWPTRENICVIASALELMVEVANNPVQVAHMEITLVPLMRLADRTEPHPLRDRMIESMKKIVDKAKDAGYYFGGTTDIEVMKTIYQFACEEFMSYDDDGQYLYIIRGLHENSCRAEAAYGLMVEELHQHN